MHSSAITIRERNKKTPAQNREKRDRCGKTANERGRGGCGECGECDSESGTRDEGENEKLVDF